MINMYRLMFSRMQAQRAVSVLQSTRCRSWLYCNWHPEGLATCAKVGIKGFRYDAARQCRSAVALINLSRKTKMNAHHERLGAPAAKR